MDRLESMGVFLRVMEERGFAAAARELGISATMVGKHILELEKSLGVRLLNRTTRRQSLTEAGIIYGERCKLVLAAAADAESSVQRTREAPRGVLRICSPVTFGTQKLVPVLADYLRQYAEVSVELILNDRNPDLIEEGCDAAIRIGRLEDSGMIACPLQPYQVILCAAPDYLARRGTPKKVADLAAHNCLGFTYWDRRSAWKLKGKGTAQTVRVQGNFTVNNGLALRNAALAGLGIVMQPEALFTKDLIAKKLVRVLPAYAPSSRPMHLVYLPDRHVTPKLRTFIDFVVKRFSAS